MSQVPSFSDVDIYLNELFRRLTPLGEQPSPRAAHVATAVGTMVVIQVISGLFFSFFWGIESITRILSWNQYLSKPPPFVLDATQGGIGPAGLSAEDLHVLDLTQQRPRWHRL